MKVIVKNGVVFATHNDNYDLNALYIGYIIRKVPNNIIYDTPIKEYDEVFKQDNDRYVIGNGDPDPISNTVNYEFLKCQIIAGSSISEEVNQYIQYKPDGEVRYTQAKQSSFTDILMYCKQWLEDNSDVSAEQKEPYETKITLINNARSWIRTVLNYYYDKIAEIRVTTEETIGDLTWDFSIFETGDPDVWLETVRIS